MSAFTEEQREQIKEFFRQPSNKPNSGTEALSRFVAHMAFSKLKDDLNDNERLDKAIQEINDCLREELAGINVNMSIQAINRQGETVIKLDITPKGNSPLPG